MTDHIEEVTAGLMETFRGLRDGTIKPKEAQELNNTAGKIISAYKARLAYHALRGEAPIIPYLAAPVEQDESRERLRDQSEK